MDATPTAATSDDAHRLKLTDFLDLATLQEIQDGFAAVANVRAVITDAEGNLLTQRAPTRAFLRRQLAIAEAEASRASAGEGPQRQGREYVAPIIVNQQRLGTIRMAAGNGSGASVDSIDEAKLAALSEKLGLNHRQVRSLLTALTRGKSTRPASIQFLFLIANAIARLCYQEHQLRQRVAELTAVGNVATMLSEARDLNQVLQKTVQLVSDVMGTRAASIRLIDRENDELVTKAVCNLSEKYLNKGPIRLSKAMIDQVALSQRGYEYVREMARDPRVQYPGEAEREGIVSLLSVGMRHHGEAVGVLRVYTAHEQEFSPLQINLLKAIAAQAAAAIESARLTEESLEAERLERQVRMAAEVQQRMLPQRAPTFPGVELASAYVPTHELGGDFYDFITLPDDNLGLVIADVSGKGVPASLIMASVRAALRAQVDNLYYLYEVMHRLNLMLHRDTRPAEFVTLFYGVIDASNRRLTYCNAGHSPPLLVRDGRVTELETDNMVLGIHPEEQYRQSILELRSGDVLLLYTDGLCDAMNFQGETFGKERIKQALHATSGSAEVIAQTVLWHMRRFAGLTKRTDDVTMVVARMT
jgi:sigma-B regulation protein RsbU (phosphoserine phosphatase)